MTLEELLVKIRVENKQAVKGLNQTEKTATSAESKISKMLGTVKELNNQLRKKNSGGNEKELAKNYRDAQKALDGLLKKQAAMKRHNVASEQYKALEKNIARAEKELDKLVEMQIAWSELGGNIASSPQFDALSDQINEANARLKSMYARQAEMAENGATRKTAEEWATVGTEINLAKARVAELESLMTGVGKTNPAVARIMAFISGVKKAGTGMKNFASKTASASKSVISWITKMGRGFGKVLSKIPLLEKIPKILTKSKKGLLAGAGLKGLLRFGAAGFALYKAVAMMKEGFKNLAQYSGQTNADLSLLMGSLATLKNALATAFAPILTAVAPALNTLIQLLVKAATAVAHFTAAFTGKSTVVVAKQQTADYAASLDDAAGAAGAANDAAKEYQKTLLGFDQMNVLNDASSSSGSGGSGGAGGGANYGDMFETVEVESGAKSLVDRIKESWVNADFTGLGRDIGNKIAAELDKIPWEKLQSIANKVGKSIATGFNGLNDSEFWASLGHSVAESVNTVITGIAGFVDNFEWKKAGNAVADGINHLFLDFDWRELGRTFSEGAKGVLASLTGLFDDIKWSEIGANVMSAITSVDWIGIITDGIKAAGSLASGILSFLESGFEQAVISLKSWIQSGDMFKDLGSLGSAIFDVGINLIGDTWNVIRTALKGIWSVVKAIGEKLGITSTDSYGLHDTGMTGGGYAKKLYDLEVERANSDREARRGEPYVANWNRATANSTESTRKTVTEIWKGFKKSLDNAPKTLAVADAWRGAGSELFGQRNSSGMIARVKTVAEITSVADKIPVAKKTVGNVLAVLDRKQETFGKTVTGMVSQFDKSTTGSGFSKTVTGMVSRFDSRTFGSSFDELVRGMVSRFDKRTFGSSFNEIVGGMVSRFDKRTLGSSFSSTITGMTARIDNLKIGSGVSNAIISIVGKADGGVYRNGRWLPITAAANGGSFSTGQMFVAREAGPELVGRIGSGTAVMNNDQIVASVSAGVYKAVSAAMSGSNKQVNVYLQGDAGKLFKAVQSEAKQFMNTTGLSPFPV